MKSSQILSPTPRKMSADWQSLLVTSGIAAGLSVLTSVAGVNVGEKGSASVTVTEIPKTVHR